MAIAIGHREGVPTVESGSDPAAQASRARVVLAREQPIGLGPITIEPARCRISREDGQELFLEPRVMQVMVAFVRAKGQILTHDDLIACCWDTRIVGSDAVNRTLSRVRRLSESIGSGAFRLETITKVGHRLVILPPLVSLTGGGDMPTGSRRAPTFGVVAAAAAAALTGSILALSMDPVRAATPTVAILAQEGTGAESHARDLEADLSRLAGARKNYVQVVTGGAAAHYEIRVSRDVLSERVRISASLLGHGATELLWSTSVEGPAEKHADLRGQMAVKIGGVLLCALRTPQKNDRLKPSVVRSFLAACERAGTLPDEELIQLLTQVTRGAPGFARGWAQLALAQAEMSEFMGGLGQQHGDLNALRAKARLNLLRARQLNPNLGAAYVAEAALLDRRQWSDRLALLEKGISIDPENAQLHQSRAETLMEVGRLTDAVQSAERAVALDPLSLAARAGLILHRAHAGSISEARRDLAAAERIWPGSPELARARFSIELRYGDARLAQTILDRGEASLGGSHGGFGAPQIMMRARLDPSPENVAAMIQFATFESRRAPKAAPLRVQSLGMYNAVDQVYLVFDQLNVIASMRPATGVLFRPHMSSVRYDARFMGVADQLGLVAYWKNSGEWPDFCLDPRLPYDCRMAAKS